MRVTSTTATPTTLGPSTTPAPSLLWTETWVYVVIVIAVVLVVVCCQSLFFYLYIRKLKKSKPPRNITSTAFVTPSESSEDRYQRAPSRSITNSTKPAEKRHSSSLYGYECVKDINNKKPTPPPTSTLPKRVRPPLPLPIDGQEDQKSSTFTPSLTQQLLEQRGRKVSTVPSRPRMSSNSQAPIPSRSPQKCRRPTPVVPPIIKPWETPKSERSHKFYESLPDLREKLPPKPVNIQPPGSLTQPKPVLTPDLCRMRRFPGSETASPIVPPKARMPLPQENNRNEDLKPQVVPPPVFTPATCVSPSLNKPNRAPGPGSISNELMEKLQRRQALISQKAPTGSAQFAKPPIFPPSKVTPAPTVDESSSDEEWTLEEINPINMYNI